jgi:hypothetical protein
MIYKNGEPYALTDNDIKTLKNTFKKFPLAIVYPPERIVKSRSPQNKKPDKPNSISFPLISVVHTSKGTESWRYAEHVIIKEHGVKKYLPKNLHYNGRFVLEEKDVELAWFLFTKSEYCKGGKNEGPTIKFMFDNPIQVAENTAEKNAIAAEVNALIWGKEMGMPEEKLREIARAYFIRGVDDMTFSQVKVAIDHAIKRDAKNGLKQFVELSNMTEFVKIRSRLQRLIDSGKLRFDPAKRNWLWDGESGRSEIACKIPPGLNANDALYDYYTGSADFRETVVMVEKDINPKDKEDDE